MLILMCTPNIKFAWSELPGRKYNPEWEFFSELYLLCCINESWQVTPLDCFRNNSQQHKQMLSSCAHTVCLSLEVYTYMFVPTYEGKTVKIGYN